MRILLLCLCITYGDIQATKVRTKKQVPTEDTNTRLERWYTGAKIAGIATLGIVTVLAYMRISKSLDSIDAITKQMQPAIKNASQAIINIEKGTRDVQKTVRQLKPAFKRVPRAMLYLEKALNETGLTMKKLKSASANTEALTGKVNALLTPQVLNNPQVQQAIQVTTASIANGISSTPQTPLWTPLNVITAITKNPTIISTLIHAWRAPQPSGATIAAQKNWRFFGWFRKNRLP